MNIKIVKGNIIDTNVEATVLPANSQLMEGSGVSTAIFEASGRRLLKKACKNIGYCEVGYAVPTLAYNLNSKYIIHAVVPRWIDGNHNEYQLLSSAYASALELADVMKCKSIAFPLLSAGNNGFTLNIAFEVAIKSIENYETEYLEEVILVVFNNTISEFIKNKGYKVTILPPNLEKDLNDFKRMQINKKIINNFKEIAFEFMDDCLKVGMEYFKVPKNRKKIIDYGIGIIKSVNKKYNM